MKVEVRCPGCNRGTLVDERSLGGELLCPGCLTRIVLRLPEKRPAAYAGAGGHAKSAAAVATAGAGEVVCPRCKLHFALNRHAVSTNASERRTVLVVEDTEIFREIAKEALTPRFCVKTAESIAEARAVLGQSKVDLMLLDLTLEGGREQGRQFLKELRPKPCPIVIFTARDESELYGTPWAELQSLGADDLVLKGMNVGEVLVRKVNALLGEPGDGEDA